MAGALLARSPAGRGIVYGGSLAIACVSLLLGLFSIGAAPSTVTLPLGLPWIGAHFRLDPLAAFFLVVVGLGSAGASLYALGYGRHEHEPQRVLPFYPAFLAGMNLVVVADDAFSFLFAWELMSLASWALVMAHHREAGNARAGFVYLVMASFSGLALLLASACSPARPAATPSRDARGASDAGDRCAGAGAGADRRRIEGRRGAAARLAAAGASRRAEPRVGADERGDDQGRGLWLRAHRLRPAGRADLVVGHRWSWRWAASPRFWACSTH